MSKIDAKGPGGFISKEEARKLLDQHKAFVTMLKDKYNVPIESDKWSYGFMFGLDQMKNLMNGVEAWNKKYAGDADMQIGGIRIYNAMESDEPTVFLIPYYEKDNANIYHVDDFFPNKATSKNGSEDDEDLILDRAFPCPPKCPV